MENEPLSRELMDAIVKVFDQNIEVLSGSEQTPDWHKSMNYNVRERGKMVNYLKRLDSTDAF